MTEFTMPALAPHIVCDGAADAIEFYKQAFGAEEIDAAVIHAGRGPRAIWERNGIAHRIFERPKLLAGLFVEADDAFGPFVIGAFVDFELRIDRPA